MAVTIDWATRVFSIPQSDLTLVSGTLYEMNTETYFRAEVNAIMASEDGVVFPDAIDHNTEYTVVGVTYARKIEMINGYSVEFTPDSQWSVRYTGSNNNLFDVENGVLVQNQVQVIPANSAGLQSFPSKDLEDIKYLIETLRPHHTGLGTVWYWNPDSGDDMLTGESPTKAFKTFAAAHAAAGDGTHDIIVALSGVSGQTITTERLTITKNDLFIRGPGRDFRIKPTSNGAPTVTIQAAGVELSSMIIDTADATESPTAGDIAVQVDDGSDFFFLDQIWSDGATDTAIKISGSVNYGRINGGFFENCVEQAIHLDGAVRFCKITDTEIISSGGAGILIENGALDTVINDGNKIRNCGTYGIEIRSGILRTIIDEDVSLWANTFGDILDLGTGTEIEGMDEEIAEMHRLLALKRGCVVRYTPSKITVEDGESPNDIEQTITGDGTSVTTVSRD